MADHRVNAYSLKKSAPIIRYINEYKKEYLEHIDGKILDANDAEKDKIVIQLPVTFNVPDTIDIKKLQTHVYHKIYKSLESRGFDVKIRYTQKYTLMQVSWRYGDDKHAESQMMKDLRSIEVEDS